MTSSVSISNRTLVQLHENARKKFTNIVTQLRPDKSGYTGSVTRSQIVDFLKNKKTLCEEIKTKSGHFKCKHKVTRVVFEVQDHGKQRITLHISQQVRDQFQEHINRIGNEIFDYKNGPWKMDKTKTEFYKNNLMTMLKEQEATDDKKTSQDDLKPQKKKKKKGKQQKALTSKQLIQARKEAKKAKK